MSKRGDLARQIMLENKYLPYEIIMHKTGLAESSIRAIRGKLDIDTLDKIRKRCELETVYRLLKNIIDDDIEIIKNNNRLELSKMIGCNYYKVRVCLDLMISRGLLDGRLTKTKNYAPSMKKIIKESDSSLINLIKEKQKEKEKIIYNIVKNGTILHNFKEAEVVKECNHFLLLKQDGHMTTVLKNELIL